MESDKMRWTDHKLRLNKDYNDKIKELDNMERESTRGMVTDKYEIESLREDVEKITAERMKMLDKREKMIEIKNIRDRRELLDQRKLYTIALNKAYQREKRKLMRSKGTKTLKKEMKQNRLLLGQLKKVKSENIHLKELIKNLEKDTQTYMMYSDKTPYSDKHLYSDKTLESRSKSGIGAMKRSSRQRSQRKNRRELKLKNPKDIPEIDLQDGAYALKQLFTY